MVSGTATERRGSRGIGWGPRGEVSAASREGPSALVITAERRAAGGSVPGRTVPAG